MRLTLVVPIVAFALGGAPRAFANLDKGEWIFHNETRDRRFKPIGHGRGTPLISVAEIVKAFKLESNYDPKTFTVTLTNPRNANSVRFRTFNRLVEGTLHAGVNPVRFAMELSKPPQFEGLELGVPLDFGDRALRPILNGVKPSNPLVRSQSRVDIVIDAGHGGNDYGASVKDHGIATREKDLTLAVAWDLKRALDRHGVKSALTREDDSFLTLPERTHFANAQHAKLFVSLHLNADPRDRQHGLEIYVLSLTSHDEDARWAIAAENQMIPEDLSEGVDRALGELRAEANFEKSLAWAKRASQALAVSPAKRPVRMGPFYVLYGAEMPALLLELGYLTRAADRKVLVSPELRAGLVERLAEMLTKELTKRLANDPNAL